MLASDSNKKEYSMKKHIFISFSLLAILLSLISCNNPFFIKATQLYEVKYSTNGGTTIESSRTDCIKEMPYTQKTDCTFCGWYTKSDFTGEAVSFPLEIKDDITLYAKWQQMYTVTFVTNGGSELESYKTGIIEKSPDIAKADFTFLGWYTTQDFSGDPISFPYIVERPTILYAKWIQTSFQVSFETNGGTVIASYKTSLIQSAPECTRENFIFDGWYTTSDFSSTQMEFPYTLTTNITLYAKWIPTYQVTFYTGEGTEIAPFRTNKIEKAPETIRSGYSFAGWYTDSLLTKPAVFPYTLQTDTIFYAKWVAIYNVTFVTNGGTSVTSLQTGYIQTCPVTTKNDNSFGGWYLDAEFTEENKVNFPYTVTGDITLYAKWKPVQCTVTYMPNGATEGRVPAATTVDKGSTYTIAGNTGNLSKQGFAFTKWNTRADGDGQGYSAGNTITVTGDIVLYAQWGKDYGAMVTVPGGWFYFGDPSTSSRPKITLSSFQIAQYELTYELWLEVYTWAKEHGYNLTQASKGYAANDIYKSFVPATNISWNMACVWLNAYSEYKNLEPVYYRGSAVWKDDTNTSNTFSWNQTKNGFRLPTECEWEFTAGGGSAETHDKYIYAGSNTIGEIAWYSKNSETEIHSVGTKKDNTLGTYDMCGNIAEWCYDYYASFGTGELTNPKHSSGAYKILRGGFIYSEENCTSIFYRTNYYTYYIGYTSETNRNNYSGIRIARNAE